MPQSLMVGYTIPRDVLPDIQVEKESALAYFQKLGVQGIEATKQPLHISLAIINMIDVDTRKELRQIITGMQSQTQFQPEFKAKGFTYLPGKYTPTDYVGVELDGGQEFNDAFEYFDKRYPVTHYPGGNKPHITLLSAPKGTLTEEIVKKYSEKNSPTIVFKVREFELWNEDFKRVGRRRMSGEEKVKIGSIADRLAWEESLVSSTTPELVVGLDKELVSIQGKTDAERKIISSLLVTLARQSQFNRPDTLEKLSATVRELEKFFVKL